MKKIMLFILCFAMTIGLCACSDRGEFTIEPLYIQEKTEHVNIEVKLPLIFGFPKADEINQDITKKADTFLAEIREAAAAMKEQGSEFAAVLQSEYNYFRNDNIVSLWIIWDNYTGGAHGLYWVDSYTFNIELNEIYDFPSLFSEGSGGVDYVTSIILDKIKSDEYFNNAAETVKNYQGLYHFLINGDKLVVYFPLYEIAPYSGGIRSFEFDLEELEDRLKPEIARAMKGQTAKDLPFFQSRSTSIPQLYYANETFSDLF